MLPFKNGCEVTSPLGKRRDPLTGEASYHAGIDMVPIGDDSGVVISPFYGTVTEVSDDASRARGKHVIITLDTMQVVVFQHLKSRSNDSGTPVVPGTALGVYGNTGKSTAAHLHIEAWKTIEGFRAYNANQSMRDELLPMWELLGIPNRVGVYEQNFDFDIVTENPLFVTPSAEPWNAARDDGDKLRLPLSAEYGTFTDFDRSKYKGIAIVSGEEYLQNDAESYELKEGVKDTAAVLKMSFATEAFIPKAGLGDYVKMYSDEVSRVVFYGRVTDVDIDSSKITMTAKNRMWYLSKSDMTIQFVDGQNTGDAVRALCNRVRLSHKIPRFETKISSSMIFYKDNFVSILKKLISHEEEFTGREYGFRYDYENAMLEVFEKGTGSFTVDVQRIRDASKSRSLDNVRNVVSGYDSSAKSASDPIVDEKSIEAYGALIHYYPLSDDTVSGHLTAYLEKHKAPLTSGTIPLEGSFAARPGMTVRLPDISPVVFSDEGTFIIDSVTHKIGEEHEMQLTISEYRTVSVPSEEEVAEFKENSVLQKETDQGRLRWCYFESTDDFSFYLESGGDNYYNTHAEELYRIRILHETDDKGIVQGFVDAYSDRLLVKGANGYYKIGSETILIVLDRALSVLVL